jgi:tRNA(fMet)-specific endonuclease VapC
MSLFVLDTDVLTLLRQSHPALVRKVGGYPPTDLAVTVITVEEYLTGWYTRVRRAKRRDEQARAYDHLARSVETFSRLSILSFPEPAILRYE